jgi:oligosaccharide reducing-end xylanase
MRPTTRLSIGKKLFVILLIFCCTCFSQKVEAPYEVGTWQGFRTAAISYTFDDNCTNQLPIAVPLFNEFGFPLTLFAVTNPGWAWPANWSGLQNAASQGHEIASHTVTHTSFSGMADSLQDIELKNSQDLINAGITGQKCVTIAYPFCNTGNNSLVRKYYFAARGCSGSIEGKTPGNFMNISSIICGTQGSVKTSADFKSRADNAASAKGWCVYLIHGINGNEPGAYSPIPADTLRASLVYLKTNPDKFWVATFGNAAKYVRERNAASISEVSVKPDSITITISDTLDNSYYDCPITVRRPLPQGWASSDVLQNGKKITSQIVEIGSVQYVMFDVVPDDGDITLAKNGTTSVEDHLEFSIPAHSSLNQNYPNPFNPATTITYSLSKNSYVSLKVYNLLGLELETLVNREMAAGNHTVSWNAHEEPSGVYFYRLEAGPYSSIHKMMLLK